MKKALYTIIILFILIQFIPDNLPDTSTNNPNDLITNTVGIPENIKTILKQSCYDCHSNETYYPWYSYVVPVTFLVARDINVGREELNFSEWTNYKKTEKAGILDGVSDAVSEGDMPMKIYTMIHRNASLSDDEKTALVNWSDEFAESLFD